MWRPQARARATIVQASFPSLTSWRWLVPHSIRVLLLLCSLDPGLAFYVCAPGMIARMLTPLAQTQVHSLGPSHGYCYALVAVNQMYATAPLLQLHSLCSLLCAQTELDLLSCEGEWRFCNCTTELCAPRLGKAWAIARAWIPLANGNFIFSITNGWLQLTITKGAPQPALAALLHLRQPSLPPSPPLPSPSSPTPPPWPRSRLSLSRARRSRARREPSPPAWPRLGALVPSSMVCE